MKILVVPSGEDPSAYYRLRWPAEELQRQGHDVEIRDTIPGVMGVNGFETTDPPDNAQVVGVTGLPYDLVVLQRPSNRLIVDTIPYLQQQGIVVVCDLDDDYSCISARNKAFLPYHPKKNSLHNWAHLARAIKLSDLVTVTTPALAKRYGEHKAAVIGNYMPDRYLDITRREEHDVPWVGWAGSVETHPDDLQVVGTGVANAIKDIAHFHVIGSGDGVEKALGLYEPPSDTEFWVSLEQYPQALAELDVGIAPLELSKFNHAKSFLKPLEYAATGVACVMSPTEPYRYINSKGVGLVAEKPKDWYRMVKRLVQNGGERQELAAQGREVAKTMTISGNVWRWAEAWDRAYASTSRKVLA